MTDQPEVVIARWPGDGTPLGRGLADLLAAYHLRTEAEKGAPVADVADLPQRYLAEILDPQAAFASDAVLVAISGEDAVGCVIVASPAYGSTEIKRLWVDPNLRGRGIASRLIGASLEHAQHLGIGTVRLSVWSWRADAIAVYERCGFTVVDSWDERDQLLCMERTA
jgi:ribosomal protein S18 acetylase RimI-like enzyme